jgi:hypothetical protein
MCGLIGACLTVSIPDPLPVDVPRLISSVTAVLDITNLDPYAMPIADLDVSSVAAVLPLMRIASYRALAALVRALGRPGLQPFAATISRVTARGLLLPKRSDSAHYVQRVSGGVGERHVAYETALSCISVFGAPAIEVLAAPLASALSEDLPAAIAAAKAASAIGPAGQAQLSGGPLQGLAAHATRPGKRRRHQVGGSRQDDQDQRRIDREAFSSADFDPPELHSVFAADAGHALGDSAIQGVDACREIFNSRAFLSERGVETLKLLERLIVSSLSAPRDLGCSVLRALAACILGGGSGRLAGRASPVLPHALFALRALSRCLGNSEALVIEARTALSACESLVHPRGAPMLPVESRPVRGKTNEKALGSSPFGMLQKSSPSSPANEKLAEVPAKDLVEEVEIPESAQKPDIVADSRSCSSVGAEPSQDGSKALEDDPVTAIREAENKENTVGDVVVSNEEPPNVKDGSESSSPKGRLNRFSGNIDEQSDRDLCELSVSTNEAERSGEVDSVENETFVDGELRVCKRTRDELENQNEISSIAPMRAKRFKHEDNAPASDGELIDEDAILSSLVVDEGPDEDEAL